MITDVDLFRRIAMLVLGLVADEDRERFKMWILDTPHMSLRYYDIADPLTKLVRDWEAHSETLMDIDL